MFKCLFFPNIYLCEYNQKFIFKLELISETYGFYIESLKKFFCRVTKHLRHRTHSLGISKLILSWCFYVQNSLEKNYLSKSNKLFRAYGMAYPVEEIYRQHEF